MISRHMGYIKIIIEFVILVTVLFLNNKNNIQECSCKFILIFGNPAFALSVLFLQMDYFFVVMFFCQL